MARYVYEKGEQCYYITLFKRCKPVTILDRQTLIVDFDLFLGHSYTYKYLIQFQNGKIKLVDSKKLF